MRLLPKVLTLTVLAIMQPAAAQVIIKQGTNLSADVTGDGQVAMDLLGKIWTVPPGGGKAILLLDGPAPASRPRWSPDGRQILYLESTPAGDFLHIVDANTGATRQLGAAGFPQQFGAWHPGGERVVYASGRTFSGLDIWETDVVTNLSWRLTDLPGDESEPVWSTDGRNLLYLYEFNGKWSIMLRRFGRADEIVFETDVAISALSLRPDGSLVTFLTTHDGELTLDMLILSNPPLQRTLGSDEDLFRFPVSWRDRQSFVYTAAGLIKSRPFNSRISRQIPFMAEIGQPASRVPHTVTQKQLPVVTPATGKIVIRTSRLFDGILAKYQRARDIVIDDGIIVAVVPKSDHGDALIVDLGDSTAMPGLIDTYSGMIPGDRERAGLQFLSYGVTTVVSDADRTGLDPELWDGAESPGPRILFAAPTSESPDTGTNTGVIMATLQRRDGSDSDQQSAVELWQQAGFPVLVQNWNAGLNFGADLVLGADVLPRSPAGKSYQDIQMSAGSASIALVSGLADSRTPGIPELLESRQAQAFGDVANPVRRHPAIPQLDSRSSSVVAGSKPNGLPPGLALHAELRALAAAGLRGEQVLQAAGINAARVLGLDGQVGRISPGALADLLIVAGDPVKNAADTLNIIAVVRNGRFYSLVRLLEQADAISNVE